MSDRRAALRDEIGRFVDALFRYATDGTFVSLRSFYHDPKRPPADIRPIRLRLEEDGLASLVDDAARRATYAANLGEPTVFAPPIATFSKRKSAAEADLVDGLALTAECDAHPTRAKALLEGLIGAGTVVVASGGTWVDPETGEAQDKLHVHWRLAEPTREPADHQRLKRARRLIALLAESDASAVPMVHPLRWPGTWHLKGEPRLARIVECNPDREVHLEEVLNILEDAANLRGIPLDDEPRRTNGSAALADDDDLMALARAIPNDADTSWDHWNLIGMAFWAASSGGDAGFAAFGLWSSKSPKSGVSGDGGTTAARWRHYRTSPPTKLTLGKLVFLARQAEPDFRLPSWDRHDDYNPFTGAEGEAPEAGEEAAEQPRGDDWKKKLGTAIAEMNDRYFVSTLGGRTVIASLVYDDALQRERLVLSRKEDVRLLYNNQHYMTGYTKKGAEIWKDLGTAWIEHPGRRTFERIALIPSGPVPPGTFNLWRGFGVEPRAGRWPTIDNHLREIVCAGNAEHYAWLMGWLAYCVQQPGRRLKSPWYCAGSRAPARAWSGRCSCGFSATTRCTSRTRATSWATSTATSPTPCCCSSTKPTGAATSRAKAFSKR